MNSKQNQKIDQAKEIVVGVDIASTVHNPVNKPASKKAMLPMRKVVKYMRSS
ncbi:Uncharacterised protein [Niallia circulans]|jgi:hypothetical protein|uniref:hypothetical protein n=1 Tax=Shouchella clausii TaxID=79880 RepID=UPI000D975ED6|nr:hypothetical protein [Shouchella clausii]MCM3548498.1 hypothetical protein [Shouchella clausii]SPT78361.1 Uncharacterised protein [Niallia circulans]